MAPMLFSGMLGLSPRTFGTHKTVAAGGLACNNLEMTLGSYPLLSGSSRCPDSDPDDIKDMADSVPDHP